MGLELLKDQNWRLNNLYQIVDKDANVGPMRLNWCQRQLYERMHYRTVVLKSRQVGITTFAQAFALDCCIFNDNFTAGIIAHTKEDAEDIFDRKIRFMYDHLPVEVKELAKLEKSNVRELKFSNGSAIRVATSLRGGTINFLHISELAKIAAQGEGKAEEVKSGSLPAVPRFGVVIAESTAEGPGGYFREMWDAAVESKKLIASGKEEQSSYTFDPIFFPAYRDPDCRDDSKIEHPREMMEYFEELEHELGEKVDKRFKNFYTRKWREQKDKTTQEYPNTVEEAFSRKVRGAIFGEELKETAQAGRIVVDLLHDEEIPVDISWDLGRNDACALWFHQHVHGAVHILKYYENSLEDITHYIDVIQQWGRDYNYRYGVMYLPHDGKRLSIDSVAGSVQNILTNHHFNVIVVDRPMSKLVSIGKARRAFSKCRFHSIGCSKGLKALAHYQWQFDETHNVFREGKPKHNWASNGADAFQTLALGSVYSGVGGDIDSPTARKKSQVHPWSRGYDNQGTPWNPRTDHIV